MLNYLYLMLGNGTQEANDMDQQLCGFDCDSIRQMLKENPLVADVIIEMIEDLGEVDETCEELVREIERVRQATAH